MTGGINTTTFWYPGELVAGKRFIGTLTPGVDSVLLWIRSSWDPDGDATLSVTVDGVQVLWIDLPAETGSSELQSLDLVIAAGSTVRVEVQAATSPGPSDASVNISWRSGGIASPTSRVEWVNGPERTTLYTVSAGVWTPVDSILLTGRATIRSDGGLVTVNSVNWLVASGGVIQTSGFTDSTCTDNPRLEFWQGDALIGALSAGAFCARSFREVGSPPGAAFEFGDGGTVIGALDSAGLSVTGIQA